MMELINVLDINYKWLQLEKNDTNGSKVYSKDATNIPLTQCTDTSGSKIYEKEKNAYH